MRPLLCLCLFFAGLALQAQTAREIVERSIQANNENPRLLAQYTWRERSLTKETEDNGGTRVTKNEVSEVFNFGAKEVSRLMERNGKPLPEKEARKEREKVEKAAADSARLTPEQREAKFREAEAKTRKERERLTYIPKAYEFTLLGSSAVNGRDAWVVQCTPRKDYRGKYDNLLRNVAGKLFIDKKDYQWVRIEAEVLDTISFGLFLARLNKGARFQFEQVRVNEEIWLPKSFSIQGNARIALVKGVRFNQEAQYSEYRKFSSESRIVDVATN